MKKLLILFIAVAFFACNQQKEDGFEIKVDLEGAEGQILLEKRGESSWIPVDTAEIVDGVAVLQGKVDNPEDHYISVLGQRAKTMVFVENSDITVSGKVDSLASVEVTGSQTHNEYSSVNERIEKIGEEYMALYQQAREATAAGDTAKAEDLMEEVNALYDSTTELQKEFVLENPGSYATPYFISRIQHGLELNELETMLSSLNENLSSMPTVQALKERVAKLKTVAVGQKAPDFTMNDTEGNPVTFSDVYSQHEYTLLDFWAAWCGPCRRENPNVVAVYEEFKDDGFYVFGVSLDREKDAWLQAIEDDNLTWAHVSDLSYWNNAAAQLYAVRSIPASLIVDQNGIIVAKDKRGDELRQTVDELVN